MAKRPTAPFLLVGSIALLVLSAPPPASATAEAGPTVDVRKTTCLRVPLTPGPTWSFEGVWTSTGSLVITDPGAGVLHVYDARGRLQEKVARPGQGALEFNRPSAIWSGESGFVLKDGSRWLRLDSDLKPIDSIDLQQIEPSEGGVVRTLFDGVGSGGDVFGAGDALMPDGSWRRGLYVASLADPQDYRIAHEISPEDRQQFDHYLMGYQLVAALGEKGYFLTLEERPGVLEVTKETQRRLESFPAGFERLPRLPLHGGVQSAEVRYRAYESATLPVGLYGRGDRLFVLTRSPVEEGGTRWTLTRIDPAKDRVDGSVVLPTNAAHLTLVPGPDHWAVLEKGRVERYGVQPITHLVYVPADWLEGDLADSPLAPEDPREVVCEVP